MPDRLVVVSTHLDPIEANLAMDPRRGVFIENGVPWTPLPLVTL